MSLKNIVFILILVCRVLCYTKVVTDNDLYGIKVALNEKFLVSIHNLLSSWFISFLSSNTSSHCSIPFNASTCDFVFSIAAPTTNDILFFYNCINPFTAIQFSEENNFNIYIFVP